jgi:tetratricopeptide (TPR) repeat protein
MTRLVLHCLLAVAVPAAVAQLPAAHAQPAPDAAKRKAAKAYVDAGLAAQNARDYETAVTFYAKAYELAPHPLLLFNIAQAYRLAAREDRAIEFYRRFLATKPTGREAQDARDLLAELEKRQAEEERKAETARKAAEAREADQARKAREAEEARKAASGREEDATRKADRQQEREPAPEPLEPLLREERSPWYHDTLGHTLVITGLITLGLGGYGYRVARGDLDTAETVASYQQALEIRDSAKDKRALAALLAGTGVALVGAGVLRYVLRDGGTKARGVGIAPARDGGLLTFTRSF